MPKDLHRHDLPEPKEIEFTPPELKLWLLSQDENTGYDTFDECVVCAFDEESAKAIHPYGENSWGSTFFSGTSWASSPAKVKAECIGVAASGVKKGELICASFNAG